MDGTCLWLWQRSLRSRGLRDAWLRIASYPCHLPGALTGVNASSSLEPLVLKWMIWGDIDEKNGQGRYYPSGKLNMAKKLEMGIPTISIDLDHSSISAATLSRSFTHSLPHSFIPHRLIHWETALILLCHWLSKRQAWISSSPLPFLCDTHRLEQTMEVGTPSLF